jgi:hypothetical protein
MTLNISPDPHQVTWANYRALRTGRNEYDAETVWNIRYTFATGSRPAAGRWSFSSLVVDCNLVFGSCWVVDGKQTAPLLVHEQGHYLIATLVAREFETQATALTSSTPVGLQNALQRLYRSEMARLKAIEDDYEKKTDHSRNGSQQHIWDLRMDAWERNNYTIGWQGP